MKKTVRIALAVATAAILLLVPACNQAPASSTASQPKENGGNTSTTELVLPEYRWDDDLDFGGIEVVIASPFEVNLTPGSSNEADRLLRRIQYVESNYNCTVTFEKIEQGAYWNNMATVIMSGDSYGDILVGSSYYLCDWIKAGAVKDIRPYAESLGLDFFDGTWLTTCTKEYTYGDAIYAFSKKRGELNSAFLYNKSMFQAANLTTPNDLIKQGKKWDFATFQDYSRKLTKVNSGGNVEQYGTAIYCRDVVLSGLIQANGGKIVTENDADHSVSMTLTSSNALEAMTLFSNMFTTDRTMFHMDEVKIPELFYSDKLGMMIVPEWMLTFLQDYATEHSLDSDYALTYFPVGPNGSDYIDPGTGPDGMFVPVTADAVKTKAALAVYAQLYELEEGVTREMDAKINGESLFMDQESVDVYVDILMNNRCVPNGTTRCGIYYNWIFDITDAFITGKGTPQSIIDTYEASLKANIEESCYKKLMG